jgi:predicted DNA-binding protein with PD1-like motif
MKLLYYILPAAVLLLIGGAAASAILVQPATEKYIATPTGYLMVLRPGDNVQAAIEELAGREHIPSASFSGIGFVNATFGYFNADTKTYEPKEYKNMELAALNGSIAWENDKPSVHMHALATNEKFEAVGGHLLGATVGTGSVEIYITVYKQRLERAKDEATGANVLQLH